MASSELISALQDFFEETWPTEGAVPEPRALAEAGWSGLTDMGLHLIGVPEEAGGSGGTLADLVDVATLVGRYAADVPVVESSLAAWAAEQASLPIDPDAVMTVARATGVLVVDDAGLASGTVDRVPWGAGADHLVTIAADGRTVIVRTADAVIAPGLDLAGQPRDTLTFDRAPVVGVASGASANALTARQSVLTIAMMAGAMQAASEMTQRYVAERVQFGKPIGSFQAVQAHVVLVAQMAVMTDSLAQRLVHETAMDPFGVSAALLVAGENAQALCRAAHQAHGAIGMTREYRLQGYTRRLHAWSAELVPPTTLAQTIGASAASAPSLSQFILDAS